MVRSSSLALCSLLLAAAALSGCSPGPEPAPTPTPAFASEDEAYAAAEETYRAYIDASNEIDLRDPRTFEAIEAFTAGNYRADERESLSEAHAKGFISAGHITLDSFVGISVDDDEVLAAACNDVSATTLTDKNGTSLVAPDRPSHYALNVEFAVDGDQVRIVAAESVEGSSCPAE